MQILRAGARTVERHPGIVTLNCFSAGAHYDPDNVAFGPVIAVDEHLLEPGAGFDWHRHTGVEIYSWVIEGSLRHEGDTERLVLPGELFVQDARGGIRHRETNAGPGPLRFVQTTVLGGDGAAVRVARTPIATSGPAHLFVVDGSPTVSGSPLAAGDSARVPGLTSVSGDGALIVVEWAETHTA